MVIKTALYLRKSREDLTESKEDTLARHEKMLNDYCAKNNLSIVAIYIVTIIYYSFVNRGIGTALLNKRVRVGLVILIGVASAQG